MAMTGRQDETAVRGWERYFTELTLFLRSISRQEDSANENFAEYAVDRLEMCLVDLSSLIHHLQTVSDDTELVTRHVSSLHHLKECLLNVLRQWQNYLDRFQSRNVLSYSVPVTQTSQRGRPKFDISQQQLEYLRSMSFKWVEIAEIIGVSYMTVLRRRREFGMTENPNGNISDAQLNDLLQQMRAELPSLGQTMIWGRLRSLGCKVTRSRVRDAIRATDPLRTALRWSSMTTRHPYSVASPNSLWHIGMLSSWI